MDGKRTINDDSIDRIDLGLSSHLTTNTPSFFLCFGCFQNGKPAAAVAAAAGGSGVRFEIKKWNAVAMWSWDICADTVRFLRASISLSLSLGQTTIIFFF
jgi:hypothetical protein